MSDVSSAPAEDPIRAWLRSRVRAGCVPGGAWWVEGTAGPISRGAFGSAVLAPDAEPTTEDTPYDLASLTKPLATALLAVLLEQDGKLDLDEPASGVLDELAGSPYEATRFSDLGTHTSGLPSWRPLYLAASSLPGYLREIARSEPAVSAGETLYSDLGFILLGAAVERVSGTGLDALFQERVAGPLGLRSAGFATAGRRYPTAAATERGNAYERGMAGEAGEGHSWRTDLIRGEVHDANAHGLGGVAGHAGLFATAGEVAAIAREILDPTAIGLRPRSRKRLLAPAAATAGFTFGFTLARESGAARGVLPDASPGHTGFTGTSVWLRPDLGHLYVLLTNRVHPAVSDSDFQAERIEFHRIASSLGEN